MPIDSAPTQTDCQDCETAVSPLAYLADLLDYTVTHLKHGGRLAVVSPGPGRLDLFTRRPDNSLWHALWNGQRWQEEPLGGKLLSDPVAVARVGNKLNIFARGHNHTLWHKWLDGSRWQEETLENWEAADPIAVSWKPGRVDLFALGNDKTLKHRWWNGTWSQETSYSHPSLSSLTGSSRLVTSFWGPERLDIFTRDAKNMLLHFWLDGRRLDAESLESNLISDPAVVSSGKDRFDIFAPGRDRGLWHKWWDGQSKWDEEELKDTRFYSSIAPSSLTSSNAVAVSWELNRIDVFAHSESNELVHVWWNGSQWQEGEIVPGKRFISDPIAISWGKDRIDIFGQSDDLTLWHKWWDGNKWQEENVPNELLEVNLPILTDTFDQPFGDLPTSCEAVERQVPQPRIVIEVLRKNITGSYELYLKIRNYLQAAYSSLLNKIGTSHEEIQLAQLADEAKRKSLANRLGISSDHLNSLLLDLSSTAVSEGDLERLFGLADTTRDPLSEGVTLGDSEGQITRWNLNGVEWGRNTDLEGKVYVRLKHLSVSSYQVDLYLDRERTVLVASGKLLTTVGTVTLEERHNSGLAGDINLVYKSDSEDIVLVAIPEFLSYRLEHLRALWQTQDWSTHSTSDKNPPIVDPDLINELDLRKGIEGDPAYQLWQQRKNWANDLLLYFKQLVPFHNLTDPLNSFDLLLTSGLIGMEAITSLSNELQLIHKSHNFDHLLQLTFDYPATELEPLLVKLQQGPDPAIAAGIIRDNLCISINTLQLLVLVRVKIKEWENASDPLPYQELLDVYATLVVANLVRRVMTLTDNPDKAAHLDQFSLTTEEYSDLGHFRSLIGGGLSIFNSGWARVFDILMNVQQRRQYATWRAEEQALNLLGPDTDGFAQGSLPVMDPDIIGPDDFRFPLAKLKPDDPDRPFDLWLRRRDWVSVQLQTLETLKELGESEPHLFPGNIPPAFGAMFSHQMYQPLQYGSEAVTVIPWAKTTQPAEFEQLLAKLSAGDDLEATIHRIQTDLKLDIPPFTRLIELMVKEGRANQDPAQGKVTAAEWQEVYSILVSAQKWSFYPAWFEEEQQLATQLDEVLFSPKFFWIALNQTLAPDWSSPWRATPEMRQAWQSALRRRSEDPLITPRSISQSNPKKMAEGNAAWILWRNRSEWIANTLEMLKQRVAALSPSLQTFDIILVDSLFEIEEVASLLAELQTTHAANGLDDLLEQVLHYPLADLPALLKSVTNQPVSVEAHSLVTEGFCLSIESFQLLMAIREGDKNAEGKPIHATAWDEVFKILTVATLVARATRLAKPQENDRNRDAELTRLGLNNQSITYLVRLRHWLTKGVVVPEAEWSNIYDILIQAQKRRRFVTWQGEEQAANITLDPLYFHVPDRQAAEFSSAKLTPVLTWRADWQARRDWQDKLSARVEQEQAVKMAVQEAVSATEEATLPLLWEALLGCLNVPGSLEDKAKWVTDYLLIDVYTNVRQKTTRVSQAIETIQNLLWSVRSGQLRDTYPTLQLKANNFDEEWQWLGSYATWRAAMLVFLYPENVLLPSLRPRQTPAFIGLFSELRADRRLNAERASQAVKKYSVYFEDICSLKVEATFWFSGEYPTSRNFFFAHGKSHTVYWYLQDLYKGEIDDAQTFWNVVPGLDNKNVTNIIGVTADHPGALTKYILLFVRISDKQRPKIGVTRYDIEANQWLGELVELELPGASYNSVVVEDYSSPTLFFHNYTNLFIREFNPDNMDWEGGDDWSEFKLAVNLPIRQLNVVMYRHLTLDRASAFGFLVCYHDNDNNLIVSLISLKHDRMKPLLGSAQIMQTTNVGKGSWIGALVGDDPTSQDLNDRVLYTFYKDNSRVVYKVLHSKLSGISAISKPLVSPVSDLEQIVPRFTNESKGMDDWGRCAFRRSDGRFYFSQFNFRTDDSITIWPPKTHLAPKVKNLSEIRPARLLETDLQLRRSQIKSAFIDNTVGAKSNLTYLEEAYYFVPIHVALQLQKSGDYLAALDWFRTVYDYSAPLDQRKIYYGLEQESLFEPDYQRLADWLLDPLNPHAIAATRRNSYNRFTLLSLVRCLLAYADAEFTRDTRESLARARTLYLTAQELLAVNELEHEPGFWQVLPGEPDLPSAKTSSLLARLGTVVEMKQPSITRVRDVIINELRPVTTLRQVEGQVIKENDERADTATLVAISSETIGQAPLLDPAPLFDFSMRLAANAVANYRFCIPANPVRAALGFQATLNLYKLRNGMNIAGMERQLEPYSAPTDVLSGLPSIGAGGQISLPGTVVLHPTPYRYTVLIERTKQLVQVAAQIEAAMLAALDKRDAETYTLLKARQDVELAQASIRFQDFRVREAQSGVKLAELQQQRAQLQMDHYQKLLDEGLSNLEAESLTYQSLAVALYTQASIWAAIPNIIAGLSSGAIIDWGGIMSNLAQSASMQSSLLATLASYERREQEWEFQRTLAQQDVRIGAQQVVLTEDRVRVVGQEREIAKLQTEHARDVVDFLGNKFTNVELYDWMSDVLEGVYSYFLQQATAVARLAESQLAFERQEVPPTFIQTDYWNLPDEEAIGISTSKAPDRRGLTGSARLLQDIYQLDQYAFETTQRKLQLTKTVSLARLASVEFQRFRETGVIRFATPMELFDRDFPGHYLRLIKRIRTSVIALIPPTQGINATLSTTGTSRVTIGGVSFQTVPRNIGPQSVALTSPRDATGLFELEPQAELLYPFEGMGMDTTWEFRLPKAANLFDYRTIADVLITIEYTSLDSPTYRQQVIQQLDRRLSADRPFSFRHQFADQWYDLHNPDQTAQPMTVRFYTRQEDFPPNIEALTIQHVVLYFSLADQATFIDPPLVQLKFIVQGSDDAVGGEATLPPDGILSTRRGNAASWIPLLGKVPFGMWELALPDTQEMRALLKNEKIEDILFVITYRGQTPAWPV